MLVLITNRKLCGESEFTRVIKEAVISGVDWVILREKDCDTNQLVKWAHDFKSHMYGEQKLIVHSNIKAALESKAEGIQFTYTDFLDLSTQKRTELKISRLLLGVSVHTKEEAVVVESLGADYIVASHVFNTDCKPGLAGKGTAFIKDICVAVNIPVIGLGGISIDNVKSVMDAGVNAVAIMSGIMACENIPEICAQYKLKGEL